MTKVPWVPTSIFQSAQGRTPDYENAEINAFSLLQLVHFAFVHSTNTARDFQM